MSQTFTAKLAPGIPISTGPSGGGQTPWLSDIDAGQFNLGNVGTISGSAAAVGMVTCSVLDQPGWRSQPNGSDWVLSPTANWDDAIWITQSSRSIGLLWNTSIGKKDADFALDVVGDVNCSGSYLRNGNPVGVLGIGRVGSDGTMFNSTWTCDHSALGTFTVTHNLGIDPTTYVVLATPSIDPPAREVPPQTSVIVDIVEQTANSFTIQVIEGSSMNLIDKAFNFGVFR